MAKLNKLVYDVRTALKQYIDDTEITDRYIIYLYNLKRSKYLRNDANNLQKTIDNSVLQKFCIEMEEVSINDCNFDAECGTIMRTKRKLPLPLELHLKSAITEVKPSTKIVKPFNFVTKDRAIWSKYSPFPESIYSFLDTDNYIYLLSESYSVKLIDCITVTGIFEDPLELKEFKNCCGCVKAEICFDEDETEYPLQAHHIDNVRLEIIKDLVGTLQIPEDKINDADDSNN